MTEEQAPMEAEGQAEYSAPEGDNGQAVETEASTPTGTSAAEENTFFDPSDLPDDLMPAYKQMQAAFTKKTQSIADQKRKIAEYDAFMRDPRAALQQLAAQYGVQLGAQQAQPQEFNPQSWDDVIAAAKREAIQEFQQQMSPLVSEVRNWKKSQLEQQFDSAFPQWREYEDQMSDILSRHPSLVGDPDALLRAAIPREVFEAQATQRALKKLKKQTDASRVSGGSQTVRKPNNSPGKLTFQEAVAQAKRQLAEQGITQ